MLTEYGVLNYRAYLVRAIFIVLVSGPNTLFVLKNSVSSGMKGGYLTACDVLIDDAVLMFLARVGVAILIKTTSILFNIIRYFDAFYLLYLGSRAPYAALKGKSSEVKSDEPQYGTILKRVLISSLTGPKTTLFYVSLFAQFIDVNAPHMGISFFILTATLESVSFCYLSFPVISGAFVTQYIRIKKKLVRVGNSLIGLMFMGFAARLVTLQS